MNSMYESVVALRRLLHSMPEPAQREDRTREAIASFLKANTTLDVRTAGHALTAWHIEGEGLPAIAFRADMDAVPDGAGGIRHACGHDGHCAILCALACDLEGVRTGKNICFIFQSGEETGEGAKELCESRPEIKRLSRIYGLHNIPGYPVGTVLCRKGCFACASCGLIVRMIGTPAHAAYPEDGVNPVSALSRLALRLPELVESLRGGRLLMATVVGLRAGGENFGLAAAEGELCLTLRAEFRDDLERLTDGARAFAEQPAGESGLKCAFEVRDPFPDTVSDDQAYEEAVSRWHAAGLDMRTLPACMRWSEDFGHYLKYVPGVFFGIGSGGETCGLHTDGYVFDDSVIPFAVKAFKALAMPQN